jgi:prepilin-type N-terminal cleavage/methylation domain-containing protein
MKFIPNHNNPHHGYTIIEMVMVIVLISILAAFSMQAIIMATGTYTTATRDYLELYQEGKLAMEKMVREIRDTNPGRIAIGTNSISFTKHHITPKDNSFAIQFAQSGNTIERQSGAGDFVLVENVAAGSFSPSTDSNDVVTLYFTVSRENTNLPLRTAVYPLLKPTPAPTPTPNP